MICTPLCVTVDFKSPEDNMATVRHCDSTEQKRLPISVLQSNVRAELDGEAFLAATVGDKVLLLPQGGPLGLA